MKAVVFHKPKDVRVDEWEDPTLQHERDAIIRTTSTLICGSDLHIYNGLVPQMRKMVLGHEFMGVVEEVGEHVTNLRAGDRVVVPFPIADGTCWYCQNGLPTHCENSNRNHGPQGGLLKGKGAGLFGYTDLYGGHDGGQAEKVRVPYADHGPRKVPAGLRDEDAVLLSDVMPTAWWANEWADVAEGKSVAIFGAGPIGIMSARIAKLRGASKVFIVDPQEYRLEHAKRLTGAIPVNEQNDDPVEYIRGETEGRGSDCAIDAVGMEADRNILEKAANLIHVQRGTMKVLSRCMDTVRRGGSIGLVGVYGTPMDNFPLQQLLDKGLKIQGAQAYVHEVIDQLMDMVVDGKLKGADLFTHTLPLEEAPYAYSIFNKKEDGCVKVLLKP